MVCALRKLHSASGECQQAGSLCSPEETCAMSILRYNRGMPTELAIIDAADLKSRLRELRRFL
jgi:hypothetical protein